MERRIIVEVQTDKDEYTLYEPVQMTLKIWNKETKPIELVFTSAQRYDFIVLKNDEEVWRWSKDKMFAMVPSSLLLKPHEKRVYTETWKTPAAIPGEYKVVGVVTSRPAFKATSTFKIRSP